MFINDIFGDNDKKLDEVSNELLSRYKKAAGADASAADKRGDIERGNKRFSGIIKATKKQLAHDVAGHKKSDVDEQAPQYTPKGVPLPTKQPAQQQPLNVPQGWEAKTQADGSTRISKQGSMSSADYKQSMADYKAKNWTPEKMADYSQRMASGQGYTDAERAANYQQQQQHFGQYADQPVDEAGPFSYGAKKPRKGSVADLAAQKHKEQERGRQPVEPRDQMVGVARVKKDVAEGISVVDQDYDLDQMHLTLNIEGKKVSFTYWDYEEDFSNAERRDVFDQLQEQPWYKGLDHPTKMEILDAAYRAIRGLEPQEYRPTVGDEPLDEQGVAEGSDNITAVFSGYGNYMKGRAANVFKHYGITVLDKQYDEDEDIVEYTVSGSKEALDKARAYLERSEQFGGMIRKQGVAEESEKNPFNNPLGKALWRDLSKEKKASPAQVQRNKERWAKRQAERKQGVAEGLNEFAPSGGGGGRWYSDDQLYDIIGEDWLEAFDVSGDQGNIDLRGERARLFLAQEAEAWLTDRGYRVNVLDVRDDGDELSWYIQGPLYRGLDEDWKKVNRRDRTPGMSRKAVKAYRRENPGSKLQTAVTTKPSKLKKGSKSAKRRKSFCARMKGMKRAHAGAKTKRDPNSPINKALRRWNCESIEEMRDLVMIAEQRISAMREGGFDIPEIPRAPQPRPEPKNKTVEDKKLSDQEKQSLRQTVKDIDYTKPPTDTKAQLSPDAKKELRQTVKDYEQPKPTNEASAREKLDRRFQELRKKRGAPDPNYYKELGKSYDIENDQERYARQAEIKKKYQVKEARRAEANFDVEDLKRLEQIRDLPTLKAQAMALISKPSERPMKPEKVAWFDAALDRMDSRMAIIKLMYDLLLSGEGHQVIGSKRSMNPNSYRSRFGESTIANEDVERYVEELERAGYEIVNERRMTCPECGGAAYADEMLAEKQDACYHKVKSRYKVWPSAYASGALVRCRKKGAKNWGNKSKK